VVRPVPLCSSTHSGKPKLTIRLEFKSCSIRLKANFIALQLSWRFKLKVERFTIREASETFYSAVLFIGTI